MNTTKKALIVIDVQNEYKDGKLQIEYPLKSLENILEAIEYAQLNSIPIIIVQHHSIEEKSVLFQKGTYEWQLQDEIKQLTPDLYIEKNYPSAFVNTPLESFLRDKEIDTLAICGYATQICCDTTARYGVHLGFNIEFLYDATGTLGLKTDLVELDAKTLFEATLATQATAFSKVLKVSEWIKQ